MPKRLSEEEFLKRIEKINQTDPCFIFDPSKCLRCGRCAIKCQLIQGLCPKQFDENSKKWLACPTISHDENLAFCSYCGQCLLVCPTNAIDDKKQIEQVSRELEDKTKIVVAQTAPAIRATIGETQNMPPGTLSTGRLVAALRKLGFNKVFDTNFGADLTTIEEAEELLKRIENNEQLPLISSCCPAWIRYMEKFFFDFKDNVSTTKSPHQMVGSVIKTYYAKKNNLDPKNIVVVSLMPCTAKKFEATREEQKINGLAAVDYVLTTRELGLMLKQAGIELRALGDEFYDSLVGWSSGAAALYGVSGGVSESVLRYISYKLSNGQEQKPEFIQVRGDQQIRQVSLTICNRELNIVIVHGLNNAKKVLEQVREKKLNPHFIEIMACPFGCIGGGGQPKPPAEQVIKKRAMALYYQDNLLEIRYPQQNQEIQTLYKEYLGQPGSAKAKEILHTTYFKREN
ncbi:MAG: [FeFe] hydrogenase, group A [Candidatus Micrarchaeota archaeon]|nr:[FeFe] hydrogenase, group A [Candidatus Micrarchaeota archaeon]